MANSPSERNWRLYAGTPLKWVKCGDEHIVFHTDSGETHYLNDFSALVLLCLEEGSFTKNELCHRLSDILGTDHAGLPSQLDSLLTRFDQLGLVESTSSAADTA